MLFINNGLVDQFYYSLVQSALKSENLIGGKFYV